MMEGDGQKAGSNWMREQWVANLRKKQMANAAAANAATLRANPVKSLGGLTSHESHTLEKNINAHNRHHHRHTQHVNMPNGGHGHAYSEKDHLVRWHLVLVGYDLDGSELTRSSAAELSVALVHAVQRPWRLL